MNTLLIAACAAVLAAAVVTPSMTQAAPQAAPQAATSPLATPAKVTAQPILIMPMGDSLTEGGPAPVGHQTYRGYLYNRLIRAGYAVDFIGSQSAPPHGGGDPDHEGHSGYSIGPDDSHVGGSKVTTNLFDHVQDYLADQNPDYILLLVGINDMFPNGVDRILVPAEAGERYTKFVAKILALKPNAKLLVSTLVPIEKKQDRAGWPEFNKLNDAIRKVAADNPGRVILVDSFKLGRWANGDWEDGVHLRKSGAQKLANVWYTALVKVLPKPVKK